ncbi:DUF7009 family protein [Tunicatimonas pelagia]|uniref:DUF7009 family protein n=1 Tax=Tunicatimonas pelagia TaxID=931531 RepID=UPI0026657C10|nr:hypothetical protein [Tunicatimonas pelagia]WKN42561.1 hypothetical protein P0M28_26345 [Tunicatimonas pelagia]
MKLRIKGNSLRLRLTQAEVQRISEGESVREVMNIGGGNPSFIYSLTIHANQLPVAVVYQNHEIHVTISRQVSRQWATTNQISIEENIPTEDRHSLHVLIEKDFRCLHRNVQDEPDQFPNPKATEAS